ncbi:MAG: hypothetical protein K5795_07685 [Lachnospiraceae bacterium]|nr:hypothetical protein [Lachnospiraceae bacterium]
MPLVRLKVKNAGQKLGILMIIAIVCLFVMTGCSKNEDNTTDTGKTTGSVTPETTVSPTATPAPTATPIPTPTPTPVPFVKTAYETIGREDVYRIPVEELKEKFCYILSAKCAGDHALLWLDVIEEEEPFGEKNILLLFKPAVSTEQYRREMDFAFNEPKLLNDGKVVVEEYETGMIHVYDDTLTEIQSFTPGEKKLSLILGIDTDGYIWNMDIENSMLIATDLQGRNAGEYSIDAQYEVSRYLGTYNGQKIFTLYKKDDYLTYEYLFISEDGVVTSQPEDEVELGDGWKGYDVAPYDLVDITDSRSTWFFHVPGNINEICAFPKCSRNESISFKQDKILCGDNSILTDPENFIYKQEFRLYDIENRTVSDVLSNTDIIEDSYINTWGMVDDRNVLLSVTYEDNKRELLLWSASDKTEPIRDFIDFSKDDPAKYLSDLVIGAKEKYGIEITPDRIENDGTITAIGDYMLEIEFVNTFVLAAKDDPEVLETKSGKAIHPENIRSNDGANYTFNPHVFSHFYTLEHGEKRRDAFFNYVDALRAGEDGFECPDEGCAAWGCGRLSIYFFPLGSIYARADYVGNGWAEITYLIPKEEFLEKEKDFEERICAILNDVLEEDYTDFEKALALYEFMTEYCVYDYEMLEHSVEWMEKQSGYRCLMEKQGICWEIACLYQYLMLQCGVDAEESSGMPYEYGADSHAWNYITLDGQGYLIDATWGLTEYRTPDLKYFLFTDELRGSRDGYDPKSFDMAGNGMYGSRKTYSFDADDDRYSELWEGRYIAMDEEEKCIFYWDVFGNLCRFDYASVQETDFS